MGEHWKMVDEVIPKIDKVGPPISALSRPAQGYNRRKAPTANQR